MPTLTIELLVVLLLILLNGAFAMSELAIVSSRKVRLEQMASEGNRGARVALELANDPNQLLATVQIGITLIGILTGTFGGATIAFALAAYLAQVPFLAPYSTAISFGLVVSTITYLSLVVGELTPKRIALNDPERIAAAIATPMRALSRLASPLVRFLNASNDLVLRLVGSRPTTEAPVTEEEIKILIEQGTQAGVFEETEQEIVESVFRLGDRRVGALMTPRPDVIWLDVDDPPEEIRRVIVECTHSRFPLARGSLDEVIGIIEAKTILARELSGEPLELRACADRPIFVPETMPAFQVLEVFKKSGGQMALVIDEYSGFQGLVTPADILDAIVGDIPSAEELAEPPAVRREDGSWLLDGILPVDDLKDLLEIEALPGQDSAHFRTVGGLVMTKLGRIPSVGDSFEWGGLRFEVVDMDRNRVDKVLISQARDEAP